MTDRSLNKTTKLLQAALVCLLFGLFNPTVASESTPIPVKVGGYLFEPFVEGQSSSHNGLTLDLIKLLNQQQSDYEFQFVPTSPKRRYIDFERHLFDVMFFESKVWGWQKTAIEASNVFLKGGEVYIANRDQAENEAYFEELTSKKLVGILGFHYGFAKFNSSEKELKKKFDITLVNSPKTIINQILGKKAEVGVVTISYLKKQLKAHPEYKAKLLISKKLDQEYHHTILVRKNFSKPSIEEMNSLLAKITKNGSLKKLLKNYGITPL